MKTITGLTLAAMLATGLMAQTPPGTTPTLAPPPGATTPEPTLPPSSLTTAEAPAPATTNTPAAKPTKKKATKPAAKKPAKKTTKLPAMDAGIKPAIPLVVNEPAVARVNLNVRGQPKINSEILARLKEGETVIVLDVTNMAHPKPDEPDKWAKIAIPASTHVFVNSTFIDENKKVKPAKLNVRSGPGENFSVVGLLHKGDPVQDSGAKGDWMEIVPPPGAYAFVAAHLLSHKEAEATPPPVTNPPPVIPTPVVVAGGPTITPSTGEAPTNGTPVVPITTPTPVVTPDVPAPLPAPVDEGPPPKRIVQREGIVRGTVSIQAPSYYELESLDNGNVIDYLYTTSTNVVLKRYKGKTVLVTGEEGLDERWPNTPVITLQKIQIVE